MLNFNMSRSVFPPRVVGFRLCPELSSELPKSESQRWCAQARWGLVVIPVPSISLHFVRLLLLSAAAAAD